MGTSTTKTSSLLGDWAALLETPDFEKLADCSCVMWICGGLPPCGPRRAKCALADQKGLIRKKDMPFGNPPYHGTKKLRTFKRGIDCFLPSMGQKVAFWVKKRCFGVFWTKSEGADLKQRQRITPMDHRNNIQSLVLPTDDPGDAPDCITEHGLCTCEYGRMCHTAPTAQKHGSSMQPKLHLAFRCGWNRRIVCQLQNMANSAKTAESTLASLKKGQKIFFEKVPPDLDEGDCQAV